MVDDIKSWKDGFTLVLRAISKLEDQINEVKDKQVESESRVMNLVDKVLGEVVAMRQEQIVHQGQHDELTERMEKLEAIRPQGQHPG
jgi:predicted  nucleic acid-binding Zn-ribbon protein